MLIRTVTEAVLAFAATNIDDLFLLIAWFGSRRHARGPWEVVAGQALGIGALLAVSALGARGVALLPGPCWSGRWASCRSGSGCVGC